MTPVSDSCYLDGRYFNLVLSDYPGLIPEPLVLVFTESVHGNKRTFNQSMSFQSDFTVDKKQPGLLRVIIVTPTSRHSNLVILDYKSAQAYRFEPLGQAGTYYLEINRAIKNFLNPLELTLNVIEVVGEPLYEVHPDCEKSGYCNAYNLLYAQSFINGTNFDPSNIREYVYQIEHEYQLPRFGEPEVEYGPYDGQPGQPQNILGGALVGGLAGGLLLGAPGALVGGLGGAAIGSTIRN